MINNKIVVLLAAYNGKAYIKEQIDSILNQEDIDVTIFISVDLSSDGTREWLESSYGEYLQIMILDDVGRFGGAAKNFYRLIRDVDFAPYDFIAFADQDDIWYEEKLSRAVQQLQERQCDGYSSNVLAFWEDGREKLISKAQPQCRYDYLFESGGPGCTYVMKRSLALQIKKKIITHWQDVNKLDFHDWYFYAFARANGFKWVIDETPSMMYRQHAHNQVGANSGWRAFVYRCKKIFTGWGISESLRIAVLIGMENNKFVKLWSGFGRFDFLRLALYANQCRRKNKEKIFFLFACIIMAIIGITKEGKK